MIYRLPLVLCFFLPFAACAQKPSGPVQLSGWALPVESSVLTSTRLLRQAQITYRHAETADTVGPYRLIQIQTARHDSLQVVYTDVADDGPLRIEQAIFISDILENIAENGETVDVRRIPNPLSGTQSIGVRDGDEWSWTFTYPEDPTPEQVTDLNRPFSWVEPEYRDAEVSVGETWDVDRATLVSIYGELDDAHPQRKTYQLDSLGTWMGRPVAYLSYGLNITQIQDDGRRLHRREAGMIIRRLDVFVDVVEQRQGTFHTEEAGISEDGTPYISVMEGEMRVMTERLLTIPAAR